MSDPSLQQKKYPRLTGKDCKLKACHEIHIFVGPIHAPKESDSDRENFLLVRQKYEKCVANWNETRLSTLILRDKDLVTHTEMKKPILTLIFRDGKGEQPVTVCQSARHIFCDDQHKVIQLAQEDAEFFKQAGFDVLRIKIEAMAYGIDGIPQTIDEALKFSDCYFEFHILVQHVEVGDDARPQLITPKEEAELRRISNVVSKNLHVPVPLSFNTTKNETNIKNGGCQRFLNVCFRGLGICDIEPKLAQCCDEINQSGLQFRVQKKISEYVWFDTLNSMDRCWIDYSPQEAAEMQARLSMEQ